MNNKESQYRTGKRGASNSPMKKALIVGATLLLSQTIGLFSLAALAADGDVRIAGRTVFTALSGDGNSITQRASTIQDNIDNALVIAQDRSPSAISITIVQGLPVITFAGYLITKVTADDATAAKTSPTLLADQWANSIRKALSDRPSVDAYIGQLSASNGAPTAAVKPSSNNQYNNGASSGNYDSYNNTNSANADFSGGRNYTPAAQPPANNYAGSQQGYNGDSSQSGGGYPQQNGGGYQQAQSGGLRQGRIAQAPAGQIISVTLATSIATQVAKPGDLLQANITQNVNLGDSVIPAGSVVIGQVAEAEAGRRLARSGQLQIKFNRIRTPDGTETPISAHIVGGIGKYAQTGGADSDSYKGETMGNKVGSVAFRGLIGAGGGAALGTAVGAIAGQSGSGAGRGAWSGTAIGGGLGVADSLLLRKGNDITVPSGTRIQLQLDAPVSIAGVVPSGY